MLPEGMERKLYSTLSSLARQV